MNLNRKETYPHPKILFIIKKYYYLYNYLTLLFENGFEKKNFMLNSQRKALTLILEQASISIEKKNSYYQSQHRKMAISLEIRPLVAFSLPPYILFFRLVQKKGAKMP